MLEKLKFFSRLAVRTSKDALLCTILWTILLHIHLTRALSGLYICVNYQRRIQEWAPNPKGLANYLANFPPNN